MGSINSTSRDLTENLIIYNSFRDENVGLVDVLTNSKTNELLIRKKFTNIESLIDPSEFPELLYRIKCSPEFLQKLLTIKHDKLPEHPTNRIIAINTIYEFSHQNVLSILESCKASRIYFPEEKLLGLFHYLIKIGCMLQKNLEHHPNVTMKNIL